MNYAKLQRLRFVDCALLHFGHIQRAALCDYFGISIPQASADFAEYMAAAPENMRYDKRAKLYRRGDNFQRAFE